MTRSTLRNLIVVGFFLGLVLGAAIYLPRATGERSIVKQNAPRFPSDPTEQGLAALDP